MVLGIGRDATDHTGPQPASAAGSLSPIALVVVLVLVLGPGAFSIEDPVERWQRRRAFASTGTIDAVSSTSPVRTRGR